MHQVKFNLTPHILLFCTIIAIPTMFVDEILDSNGFFTPENSKQYFFIYLAAFCFGGFLIAKKISNRGVQVNCAAISKTYLFSLTLVVLMLFLTTVLPNFIGEINRGVARTQYGLLGPPITFITLYLIPLMCLDGWINYENKPTTANMVLFLFQISLTLAFSVLSGYKSSGILLIFPLIMYITQGKISFKIVFFLLLSVLLVGIVTTMVTTDYVDFESAFYFLLNRIFFQSAYGLSAIYSKFSTGGNFSYILIELFGFGITSFFGIDTMSHMATNISVEFYGPTEEVLARQTNVTPSPFGEGIYIFGLQYAWLHGFSLGVVLMFLFKNALILSTRGSPKQRFWIIVFVLHGILLLNGSSIFSIISLPTLVYLFILRKIIFN